MLGYDESKALAAMSYSRGPRAGGPPGETQRVTATVKWFNRTKGFGFIQATDGSGDVFLPASTLGVAGYQDVGEGVTIVCDVATGAKGRAVVNIIDIDTSTAESRPQRDRVPGGPRPDRLGGRGDGGRGDGGGFDRQPAGPAESLSGVVKWFDVTRGFGFISPSDGGKDVFIHVSALRRSGLDTLTTGQNVRMMVQEARRGREAASVELV
jgi:CspA family cold shock protein